MEIAEFTSKYSLEFHKAVEAIEATDESGKPHGLQRPLGLRLIS